MRFQAAFVRRILPARHRALRTATIIAAVLIIAPTLALAADTPGAAKGSDAIFIAELGLLLLVGRLMGEAAAAYRTAGRDGPACRRTAAGSFGAWADLAGGAAHAFSGRRRTEKHDRCGFRARHPDAAAADRHGNRSPACATCRPRGDYGRGGRRRTAIRLRLSRSANFCRPHCCRSRTRGLSPPFSSAPRCRSLR